MQAYRDELYRFVLKRMHDAAVAEDIVQDVLVKAYMQQQTLKEPAKLRAWLYQITRHAMIDYFRLQKPAEPLPDDLTAADSGVEQQAERELARCLVPLLNALPAHYGAALKLAELEGVPQGQVAAQLGVSLSGAKSRVQRGRKMLREALLQCCQVELDRRGGVLDYAPRQACDGCADECTT